MERRTEGKRVYGGKRVYEEMEVSKEDDLERSSFTGTLLWFRISSVALNVKGLSYFP